MKDRVTRVLAVLVVAAWAGTSRDAAAQAPASRAVLKRKIETASVVVVNPAVVNPAIAAGEHVQPPPAPPPPPTAQPEPAPGAPDHPVTESGPVAPPAKLARGRLYVVTLPREQEAQAKALVAEQVAAVVPSPGAGIHAFDGVVRQMTESDVEVQLKPYVLVGHALTYVPETKRFTGTVVVGVADLIGSTGSETLSAPLMFEVLESQQRVSLNHLSPPFERFDVSSDATGEPVTVRIASNFSREGVSVTVPIERTLFVEVDNDNLRGLGLQTTRVTVRAVGGDTIPTGTVSLSAPGAFITDSAPSFDSQGLAHTEVRSDSPGKVFVRATATGYRSGESPVTVVWPWQTLVATIFGGVVGGFIRFAPRIRRGMDSLRFLVALASAALTGLLVFALYVLGVKLLPVRFGVEVGDLFAFAAAGLGGWLGSSVLPKLSMQQQ